MRKTGIREIARLANVSPGTVDRALHGRRGITPETRARIVAIAESIGYSPDLAARALSIGRAPVQIGICVPREIHYYFDHLLQGMLVEARRFERLGVQVINNPTERFGVDDTRKVRELLDARPQALILAPGSPEALTPLIDEAEKDGIRVICVDTDAPSSKRSTLVAVDAGLAGRLAAELMSSLVERDASVVVITGMLDLENHARTARSFVASYAEYQPGSSPVEIVEAFEDEDESFRKCYALLNRRPTIAGMYVNTANSLPVCRAISVCGLSGKVRLITSDVFRDLVPFFDKGTVSAAVHGRPFALGETAMSLIVDHLLNGKPLPTAYHLMPQVVLRSNCRYFRETRRPDEEPLDLDSTIVPTGTASSQATTPMLTSRRHRDPEGTHVQ